jgi:hypothetical protein
VASGRVGVTDESADCAEDQHSFRSKGEDVSAGHGCDENVQREPQQKGSPRVSANQSQLQTTDATQPAPSSVNIHPLEPRGDVGRQRSARVLFHEDIADYQRLVKRLGHI